MTVFIIVAALLVIVTIGLLFYPLLKKQDSPAEGDSSKLSMQVLREQLHEVEQARAAGQIDAVAAEKEKMELERRALEEHSAVDVPAVKSPTTATQRKFIIAAAVVIPLMAAGLYWLLGSPGTLKPDGTQAPADHAGANHSLNPQQITAMAEKLAERLASNPMDGEGWLMLGRSYAAIGRYPESAAAFGRAVSILPPNPNYLADYADILAIAQGRRLSGEPEKIIAQALSLDPNHLKALALSGTVAYEKGDYLRAVSEWQKILMLVPPESNVAQGIRSSIADAQSRMGQAGGPAAAKTPPAASPGAGVSGNIAIAPQIKGQVSPSDTVFVIARPVDGTRMPLAIRRMTVSQLPSDFTLDDSMSMSPAAKLSNAKQVIVSARISKSGSATPQPGDFEGIVSKPIPVGSKGIKLVIDSPVK